MGRAPCCSKVGLHRGPWTAKEDALLTSYIQIHGEGNWRCLPDKAGLLRCGKSCRLRWMNYLHPNIKRGNISAEEEDLIIRLHWLVGNRWSLIAGRLPGRTDNEIKNYWNSHLSKKLKRQGFIIREGTPKSQRSRAHNLHKKSDDDGGKNDSNEADETCKIIIPKPTRFKPIVWSVMVKSESNGTNDAEKLDQTVVGLTDATHLDLPCNVSMHIESLERLYKEYSQLL